MPAARLLWVWLTELNQTAYIDCALWSPLMGARTLPVPYVWICIFACMCMSATPQEPQQTVARFKAKSLGRCIRKELIWRRVKKIMSMSSFLAYLIYGHKAVTLRERVVPLKGCVSLMCVRAVKEEVFSGKLNRLSPPFCSALPTYLTRKHLLYYIHNSILHRLMRTFLRLLLEAALRKSL